MHPFVYYILNISNRDNMLVFRANRQFIISSDAIRRVHNYFKFKLKA